MATKLEDDRVNFKDFMIKMQKRIKQEPEEVKQKLIRQKKKE